MVPIYPRGKTALVLAGGGLTGAVYEIGALRAIQDLLVDRTVNDFDIYVGTSAGALVGTMLANGLSPQAMLQAIAGDHQDLPPFVPSHLFRLNTRTIARWGLRFPYALVDGLSRYLRHFGETTLFDLLWSLGEGAPPGLYDNSGIEEYVREVLGKQGCCNDFRELTRDLHIIATDLDNGDRAVFSRHSHGEAPISQAVAASSAVPILYKPVRIGGHEYVDGSLRGTASLDLAIEHGARLVICINPMVPFDNSSRRDISFLDEDEGYLSERGVAAVVSQVSRINTHSGLHYHIKQLRRSNPDVDIILIEPRRDDYQMFFYNIMRYSTRLIVARHGFESVTVQMAEDYARYQEILARHEIEISRQLVVEELNEIQQSEHDPEVISGVLERRGVRSGASWAGQNRTTKRLSQTLADLERTLDDLSKDCASTPCEGDAF